MILFFMLLDLRLNESLFTNTSKQSSLRGTGWGGANVVNSYYYRFLDY